MTIPEQIIVETCLFSFSLCLNNLGSFSQIYVWHDQNVIGSNNKCLIAIVYESNLIVLLPILNTLALFFNN